MALDVRDFSEDNFYEALSNPYVPCQEVRKQKKVTYLYKYLSTLQARSIVIETEYIDRDYLDDFAEYYLGCFDKFDRWCKRVHFFRDKLTKDGFLQTLRGPLPTEDVEPPLQASYLGFVVVRPLPQAIVGRTVLRAYARDE